MPLSKPRRRFVSVAALVLGGSLQRTFSAPRLLVVLDLDETLLHATLCKVDEDLSWLPARVWQPRVDFEAKGKGLVLGLDEEIPLFVSLRPGAEEFLEWLKSADVDVAVYTAGTEPYAKQSVVKLALDKYPSLFRDECVPFGLPITKDLTKLREDLSRVVLVDNSRRSFWLQPDNGLLVSDWDGRNSSDEELKAVKATLLELLQLEDVRPHLRSRLPQEASVDVRLFAAAAILLTALPVLNP
ncbi:unnamed protein product [Effrenium voratum]|uniref:Mitochondrial import inner membrane translocase subunit TIM50 n=1 Tax=Effrenium voratum TaxID=2562239 RepID=A0AA36MNR6_9DINO|nr:unnamed protein product [Effrenium voratum]